MGECARRFHGDTLLWAGCHTDLTDTVRGCMVRNRFYLETCAGATPTDLADQSGQPDQPEVPEDVALATDTGRFRADLPELPIPNNALDAVVLHHVLEGARDPRTAIREVSRVLAPGGRLLIVTFNPWSLWGVRGAYARVFRDSFSGLRFVSSRRLQDWLTVLGFELQQEVKYLAYNLPFATSRVEPEQDHDLGVWSRFRAILADRSVPFGGVYVLSAVKQATAVRPDWQAGTVRGRKLAPAAYPKLSARVAAFPSRDQQRRIQDPG